MMLEGARGAMVAALAGVLALPGCGPQRAAVERAAARYGCAPEQIRDLGGDAFDACGYRFRYHCTYSFWGNDPCSLEIPAEMEAANFERRLRVRTATELSCAEPAVHLRDDDSDELGGAERASSSQRAVRGEGCGRARHWLCPDRGDADAVERCKPVSDDEMELRTLAFAARERFRQVCEGQSTVQRATRDGAYRSLHDGGLVAAFVVTGCNETRAYRCPLGPLSDCEEARPRAGLDERHRAAVAAWAESAGVDPALVSKQVGLERIDDRMRWRRWTELRTAGQVAYLQCAETLVGEADARCTTGDPRTAAELHRAARDACKREERCRRSGSLNNAERGRDGAEFLVDIRPESKAQPRTYRCSFDVAVMDWQCRHDTTAQQAAETASARAAAAFSAAPQRAACPARDLRVTPKGSKPRGWAFEVAGCGERIEVVCPDDGAVCGAGTTPQPSSSASVGW